MLTETDSYVGRVLETKHDPSIKSTTLIPIVGRQFRGERKRVPGEPNVRFAAFLNPTLLLLRLLQMTK